MLRNNRLRRYSGRSRNAGTALRSIGGASSFTISDDAPIRIGARLRVGLAASALTIAAACASPEEKVERYTESGFEFLEDGQLGRANVQFRNALKRDEDHVPALEGLFKIAEQRSDFRAMFGLLQRIARLDPANARARTDLAKLHLLSGDEQLALERVEEARVLDPDDAEAIGVKAAIMFRLQNREEALKLAREALSLDPSLQEAVSVLATDRLQNEDFDGAIAILDEGIRNNPQAAVLHLLKVQVFGQQGREADILEAYRNLIEAFPDEAGYRRLYVAQLVADGDNEEARRQLMKVVELSPDDMAAYADVVRLDYRTRGAEKAAATFAGFVEGRPDDDELKFAYAAFLRGEGRNDDAGAIYEALSARRNDEAVSFRALNQIAAMKLVDGARDEAEEIIDRILEKDDRNSEALAKRASLSLVDGDTTAAINDLRLVIADAPEDVRARLLMAAAYEQSGQPDAAEGQYAEAFERTGDKALVGEPYARFLLRRGKIDRAERVLTDVLAVNSSEEDILKLLAAVRLQRQDWRGAEEVAQLLKEAENQDDIVTRILGAAYSGLGDYTGAIDVLGEADDKSPLASRPLATLVNAYIQSGRQDEAEEMLRAKLEADANNYEAYLLLAQTLASAGRPEEAREALRDAIDVNPERVDAYELLYRSLLAEGRREDAGALLDQGVARAPESDGLRVLKGDFLIGSGKLEEALVVYEDILSRRPNDVLVANNYAALLTDLRDDAASLRRAADAAGVLSESANGMFLDTYGWALYRAGDVEKGVDALRRAVEANAGLPDARYHLGAALWGTGEKDDARAHLQWVIDEGGRPDLAEKARALLAE